MSCNKEQLEFVVSVYEIFGEDIVEFTPDAHYHTTETTGLIFRQYHETFKNRGQIFRTANDSMEAIINQPDAALDSISQILAGAHPSSQKAFNGTIFSEIPVDNSRDFWAELWCRLMISFSTNAIRSVVTNDHSSIAIFGNFGIGIPEGVSNSYIQRISSQLFWNREWHRKRLRERPNNLIVERPVTRLTRDTELYVTSQAILGDSLNHFVESAIMRYYEASNIFLSQSVFERNISFRFEQLVIKEFERHGFVAGSVTEDGTWKTEDGSIVLSSEADVKMPGQIDILAYHPGTHYVFVIECKVLSTPYGKKKMINLLSKIGAQDSEGFHAKLRNKINWVKSTDFWTYTTLIGNRLENPLGAIILDRIVPGMQQNPNPVIDIESLKGFLEQNFG